MRCRRLDRGRKFYFIDFYWRLCLLTIQPKYSIKFIYTLSVFSSSSSSSFSVSSIPYLLCLFSLLSDLMITLKLLFLLSCLIVLNQICHGKENNTACLSSSCGNIKITFPFILKSHQQNCTRETIPLTCENNITLLHKESGTYIVQSIDYNSLTIRLVDATLHHTNNCSSLPQSSLSPYNASHYSQILILFIFIYQRNPPHQSFIFVKCGHRVRSPRYLDTGPCINGSRGHYSYVIIGRMEVGGSCRNLAEDSSFS